jgi:acyl dehydratase
MKTFDELATGDRFESRSHTVTGEEIASFAREFDPQPFHLGEEEARGSFFGRQVASGWHTAALTMRLLVETRPFTGGIVGGAAEVTWPRPTFPGDTLRVVAEVAELIPSRSRPDRGMVVVRSETLNQRDEVVQVLVTRLVMPREDRAAQGLPTRAGRKDPR